MIPAMFIVTLLILTLGQLARHLVPHVGGFGDIGGVVTVAYQQPNGGPSVDTRTGHRYVFDNGPKDRAFIKMDIESFDTSKRTAVVSATVIVPRAVMDTLRIAPGGQSDPGRQIIAPLSAEDAAQSLKLRVRTGLYVVIVPVPISSFVGPKGPAGETPAFRTTLSDIPLVGSIAASSIPPAAAPAALGGGAGYLGSRSPTPDSPACAARS
jgi:hypothetical protein